METETHLIMAKWAARIVVCAVIFSAAAILYRLGQFL